MAFEQINRGTTANDGTGDNLREAFRKVNDNFDDALEKVTTSGVERVYTINADGSQGTKATSEFNDVLEFANLASFPTTGESGKIYIALDTNLQYRWSGSAYVQIGGGDTSKFIYRNTNKYSHTGTTSETLMFQTTIPANTISTADLLEFIVYAYRFSGTVNNIFPRVKISNTNNFATATQIATTALNTSTFFNKLRRESMAINGKLRFALAGTNQTNVDYVTFTSLTDYTIDFTQDIYVFFSLLNQSATDVSEIEGAFIIQR